MKKFIVNKKLFEEYKGLKIGVIECKNIDNTKNIDIKEAFDKVTNDTKNKFDGVELASYPIIRKWRDIYKSFGEKKSRSSVEALIRRTVNGNPIPSINPLVDIYNMISLKYELPCGGEDLSQVTNDIELTYANGDEEFLPLGEEQIEIVNPGEIVYKFNKTVMCRNFNYRESDITKLKDDTKDAVLVIESVEENAKLDEALQELANLVEKNLGGTTKIYILTDENNEIEIEL